MTASYTRVLDFPQALANWSGMLRILQAVRLSAGLGSKQIERCDKAVTVLAKAKGGAS